MDALHAEPRRVARGTVILLDSWSEFLSAVLWTATAGAGIGVDKDGDPIGSAAPTMPAMALLGVWLYGFMTGLRSSRKLEAALPRARLPYMWLTGCSATRPRHVVAFLPRPPGWHEVSCSSVRCRQRLAMDLRGVGSAGGGRGSLSRSGQNVGKEPDLCTPMDCAGEAGAGWNGR